MARSMRVIKRLGFWLTWPVWAAYFHSRLRVAVLLTCKNEVLLVQGRWDLWFADPMWMLPGGGLHGSEDIVATAIREIREELGLQLVKKDCRVLGPAQLIRHHGVVYPAQFIQVELKHKPSLTLQRSEIAAAKWLDEAAWATQLLSPEVVQALQLSHATEGLL